MKSFTLFFSLYFIFSIPSFSQTVWTEDWESGIGSWFASNGVWEVGMPTAGPGTAHSIPNCAGTVLGGLYPNNTNTRLISPEITLPGLSTGEELQLRFWHWFSQYPEDPGVVQISEDNGMTWTTISNTFDWNSVVWTQYIVDISDYVNSTVRFAFYFTSNGSNQSAGWYVDDISIVKGVFTLPNPEDFELGIGDWYADNGLWEVGMPTAGPGTAHSIPNCAGTVLGGIYSGYNNTRLISPEITLIPQSGQTPVLFFWHWFSIYAEDSAVVQISVEGGPWETISNSFGPNSGWTQFFIDLSTYTNSTVRFAFYFTSNGSNQSAGWYIDDIIIEGIITTGVDENKNKIPNEYTLSQSYPNPFNPTTTINYQIPELSFVTIKVYDVLGSEIATLVNEERPVGNYEVEFNATNLPSGIYFYRLQAGSFVETKKMVLMK